MSTPIDFSAYVINNMKIDNLTQEHLVRTAFNLLKGTYKSRVELKYHFKECYKAITYRLDWNNPEGQEYPFDLSKPLLLIKDRGRQVVPANYFFNNDLEYLKGRSSSKKYTTSTTKTKAAKYDNIKGIEDMVLTESKHDVFSTKRIIAVTYVKVMKLYDYGYMEEIEVRREDQSLHKFKEDDFPRLNMCNIEDMLLHLVWKKISNLGKEVIYDLNVALQMFTIPIVILKRVEDLQLGFCDGTLTSVQKVLHNIASNLRMEYLLKRRWSKLDRKRSHIMIKVIDQQLFERRLMRNLEKFVSGRAYGEDFRLLEQKI
ncbi:hypothetical protein Tco_1390602 [Tanacetum coccineum]